MHDVHTHVSGPLIYSSVMSAKLKAQQKALPGSILNLVQDNIIPTNYQEVVVLLMS